ncbi:hypothetical protein [Mycobacterium sp. HM-7]
MNPLLWTLQELLAAAFLASWILREPSLSTSFNRTGLDINQNPPKIFDEAAPRGRAEK